MLDGHKASLKNQKFGAVANKEGAANISIQERIMIRQFKKTDEKAVVEVWLRSGKAEYDYLPDFLALDSESGLEVFQDEISGKCDIWVAELDGDICGYIAMIGSHIDRLYIDPNFQHCGVGTKLLQFAKANNPNGLTLRTHLQNIRARRFYEYQGFKVNEFGISPAPESLPDVEYVWG